MKPTIKSINAAMPRLDTIRRNYMFPGETGFAHGYGYLAAAYADLDDNGNVTNITLYAVGDAKERRHYYNEPGTITITDAITAALEDWQMDRRTVVGEIQDIIRKAKDARIPICSILRNDSDEERQIISYDQEDHRLYSDAQEDALNDGFEYKTLDEAAEACEMMYFNTVGWDPEWIESI